MFAVQIGDGNRQVAIAVAERIGFLPTLVDGEFEFERGIGIAQIDERKSSGAVTEMAQTDEVL